MAQQMSMLEQKQIRYQEMGSRFHKWCLEWFGTKAEAARRFGKTQSTLDRYWNGQFPISSDLEQKMLDLGASVGDVAYVRFGTLTANESKHTRYNAPHRIPIADVKKIENLLSLIEKFHRDINLDTLLKLVKALVGKRTK